MNFGYTGNKQVESYRLIDISGQVVKKSQVGAESVIHTSNLESGVYVLQVYLKDGNVLSRRISLLK